jgi:hypothetical protein
LTGDSRSARIALRQRHPPLPAAWERPMFRVQAMTGSQRERADIDEKCAQSQYEI